MRSTTAPLIAAGVGVLMLLAGCVSSRPYQTDLGPRPTLQGRLPGPPAPQVKKDCPSPAACMVFVEYDDYGNLMNRAQMLGAVTAAEETAAAGGSVLVYVHGWHHSANNTGDVIAFRDLVKRGAELDTKFRPGRRGSGNILGVYVGWRGDSIPSSGITKPLSYLLTFWDRKSASHDIGTSGGVYELFTRLSELRRDHADSRLLIHGHSMGGAVVFSTVAHTLMDQIRMDASGAKAQPTPIADLVVLVNPAFEAMKLRPQLDLARTQEYKPNMPPRLVIITTQEDWATGIVFRAGRTLGTPIDFYADDESPRQNKVAIGHYVPYVTHQLAAPKADECSLLPAVGSSAAEIPMVRRPPRSLFERLPRIPFLRAPAMPGDSYFPVAQAAPVQSLEAVLDANRPTLCFNPVVYSDASPLLLRRCDRPGHCSDVADEGHHVPRGKVADGLVPYRLPIMNIRTTDTVSTGHNDIRNPTIENFVVQLMALAVRDPGGVPIQPAAGDIPMIPRLPMGPAAPVQ